MTGSPDGCYRFIDSKLWELVEPCEEYPLSEEMTRRMATAKNDYEVIASWFPDEDGVYRNTVVKSVDHPPLERGPVDIWVRLNREEPLVPDEHMNFVITMREAKY